MKFWFCHRILDISGQWLIISCPSPRIRAFPWVFYVIAAKTTREYHSSYLRLHTSTHECMWVTCEYTRLNMVTCRLTLYTITLVTCESIGAIKMKCTIFLALCFISTCARDMLCIHNQANASATRVRTTHMRHTSVPQKTRVQSKLQLRGETLSVNIEYWSLNIGE